jgi:hypothetical protein
VIGQRFRVAKQRVALFCVALCLALSAQMTVALADRLEHAFGIPHAPNAVAGAVVPAAGHHHTHDHADHAAPYSHHHDGDATHDDGDHGVPASHHHDEDVAHDHGATHQHGDHNGMPHEHQTQGMLLPWIVSGSIEIVPHAPVTAEYRYSVTGHPDAPVWQRERPPKADLERIA